eukprot:TRINITY_DN990_c0_g1_i2.p1 TRINITY_DN990_c0_g1~~TRINITY_DN990_c0_g1_i2.p1  ORF type:complete len:405 (+),score=77.27 TRINITY_DN990_c0_g1_i2:70-1284(+)
MLWTRCFVRISSSTSASPLFSSCSSLHHTRLKSAFLQFDRFSLHQPSPSFGQQQRRLMATTPTKHLVAVADFLKEASIEQEILSEIADVEVWNGATSSDFSDEQLARASAIIGFHTLEYDAKFIERMKNAKMFIRFGAGYDNFDIEAAAKHGIAVCNVPDYGTEEVADTAIALMLSLLRKTWALGMKASTDAWKIHEAKGSVRVRGKKLGIVGLGRIGKAVALRAKAFGMDVSFYDPYLESGIEKALGISRVETMKELMSTIDVLSLNCYLSKETFHIINEETLSYIPDGKQIFIVNTARGPVIDEHALVKYMEEKKKIAGVGLDVLEVEPLSSSSPLYPLVDRPYVHITPHIAWHSDEAKVEMRQKGANEILRVLKDEAPRNCVNLNYLRQYGVSRVTLPPLK